MQLTAPTKQCLHERLTHQLAACPEPCGVRHQICDDCQYPLGVCYFKADEILHGNVRQKLRGFYKNGKKAGKLDEQKRMLGILEFYGVIWWDESQRVWLNMHTGKAMHGLDWREEQLING